MSECDLSKDRTWSGQWHCATHAVWFRAEGDPEACPAGEQYDVVEAAFEADLTQARAEREAYVTVLLPLCPQTWGEALLRWPWIVEYEDDVGAHVWDNRTTAENAAWFIETLWNRLMEDVRVLDRCGVMIKALRAKFDCAPAGDEKPCGECAACLDDHRLADLDMSDMRADAAETERDALRVRVKALEDIAEAAEAFLDHKCNCDVLVDQGSICAVCLLIERFKQVKPLTLEGTR